MRASGLLCKFFVTRPDWQFRRVVRGWCPIRPYMTNSIKAVPVPAFRAARAGNQALIIIGVFKLLKAALFLAAALGVLSIVHKDTQVELKRVLHVFRISGDRVVIQQLLLRANLIDSPHKKIISCVLAFYAGLFATEGTGLMFRKRWAEWFTAILTSTGIPIEVYELFHRPNGLKIAAFGLNVLIVWFLVVHLRRSSRRRAAHSAALARVEVG